MRDWLRHHPDVRTIRVAAADLNGQARGKRIPVRFADKVVEEGTRFPFSVMNLDIWGEDIEDSPLVFETGDADGVLRPTERGFMPVPWLDAPSALLPIWMFREDGRPFEGDPRHALAAVLAKLVPHLGAGAVVVVERSSRTPEPAWPGGMERFAEKKYGETRLWFAEPGVEAGDLEAGDLEARDSGARD